MNTDIEYLQQLETDLKDAAAREASGLKGAATPARHRTGQMWMKVAGVAAAFIVVAGAIGFVAGGGSDGMRLASRDPFHEVGDAGASDGSGDGGSGVAPGPAPQASAAPTTDGEEAAVGGSDYLVDVDNSVGRQGAAGGQQQDLSKIVRDGRIGIVVPDDGFGEAVGDLTFIAEQHGGFILSSDTQNDLSGTFVLRIPARRFDRALADVRGLAFRVRFQQTRGDDVTAEFIDYQARLRILRAQRALLFDLFQQADTTEEILRMAGQLDDVRLRIEQIQGQLRFINDQVSESTLRVSIQERNAPETVTETGVDNPDLGSFIDLAVQGFLRIVGAVIVGLGYLIPFTVLGALVWVAVRLFRRRRATA
ncbi:MAG TPA: DUF4349 domain-containing protein [Actinomycetota bacterium]|nr:DUF4349 domain-containing protein [Actinomycetota bacterium]